MAAAIAGRHPLIVGALGTLLAAGVLGVSVLTLVAARDTAIQHAHETSRNVAAVLSSNISRTIESSDQSLQSLIAALDKPAVQHMSADVRHELLFNRTAASRYVTGMGVLGERGQLIDGCCSSPRRWDFSDRDYFLVHRQSAKVGLYISGVYRARARAGVETMALSRRIDNADGSFKGVALVAIDVAYFSHLLDDLDVGPHGFTAVVRADGTLVARNPYFPPALALKLGKSSTFPRMTNQESGFYAAHSPSDGVLRLYTFQRVPGTPLIAVVAPALGDVLASWRTLSWVVGVCATAISFAFCAVTWLLAFALRDRALAEDRLTELTQTDSLTGLKNRRALDEVLENEWERLQRNDSSLSVLYVDADHFKQYNDQYGHAEGDKALKHLAACIAQRVRRRGDCAARYGGEEFVVVLPDTDAANALLVAEGIREDLERSWQAPREAGMADLRPFTVSIGCATGWRARPASLDELTKAADLALYEAKRAGRNCIRLAAAETSLGN
ncbi:GGDEF domain-containing protein [Paraburkholderia kururiensis]|uniref:GGDEF domain-containing protein n=1 Tax=Paraburkholderia kururiensis TaxID=984307 RepID=UPI0005A7C7CD|nr:GGDEF domain-containing protein [Paraburkholderia kururiensis]